MAEPVRERREYFRIDDKIQLQVRRLTEEEFQTLMKGGPKEEEGRVLAQLRTLTNQMGNTLIAIRKSNPEVAQYLHLLDKKIEILARHLEGERGEGSVLERVNLGAGGLAYWADAPLPLGAKVELRFVIFPSYLRVTALAHVVHVDEPPGGPRRYRIGVDFVRIGEAEQEGLARHLIELQSAQLRRQRGK